MIEQTPKVITDLDGLADLCDKNFEVIGKHINGHEDHIKDLEFDVKELFTTIEKLTKRCKRKASKLGLFMVVAAGIVYVIKNEIDKDDMRQKLIEQDKAQRFDSELESEGEAMDLAFI